MTSSEVGVNGHFGFLIGFAIRVLILAIGLSIVHLDSKRERKIHATNRILVNKWSILGLSLALWGSWGILALFAWFQEIVPKLVSMGNPEILTRNTITLLSIYGYGWFLICVSMKGEGWLVIFRGWMNWKTQLGSTFLGLVGYYASLTAVALVERYLEGSSHSGAPLMLPGSMARAFAATSMLATIGTLFAAVGEECFYRGVMQDTLTERCSTLCAVFVPSFIFASAHLEPFSNTLVLFVLGIIAALLRAYTRGLAAPVLFHVLINILNR